MKSIKLICVSLAISILIGCKENGNSTEVLITTYQIWHSDPERVDRKDSISVVFEEIELGGISKKLVYRLNNQDVVYEFNFDGGKLFFDNTLCDELYRKSISLGKETYDLIVYSYDDTTLVDEESRIYFNHKYGIVAIDNYVMGPVTIFEPAIDGAPEKIATYEFLLNEKRL